MKPLGPGMPAGWEVNDQAPAERNWRVVSTCERGGSVTLISTAAGGQMAKDRFASLIFCAPPDTRIVGYELWRATVALPVNGSPFGVGTGDQAFPAGGDHYVEACHGATQACLLGDAHDEKAFDPANHVAAGGSFKAVFGLLRCEAASCPRNETAAYRLGQPIAGARLSLQRRLRRTGAAYAGRAGATTDRNGRFRVPVRARTSATLRVAYTAYANDRTPAAKADVRLRVPARARLSARPRRVRNHGRVRFSGRLLGGSVPRGGKVVEIQAREGRRRWQVFRTVRANRRGRFRTSYRFRNSPARTRSASACASGATRRTRSTPGTRSRCASWPAAERHFADWRKA